MAVFSTKSFNPNNPMPTTLLAHPQTHRAPAPHRRSLADLLAPLDQLAVHSANLVVNHDARFEAGGDHYALPRYLFVGPKGGDTPIRLGIFAGVHGDEPEGCHALVQFIKLLEAKPELAKIRGKYATLGAMSYMKWDGVPPGEGWEDAN